MLINISLISYPILLLLTIIGFLCVSLTNYGRIICYYLFAILFYITLLLVLLFNKQVS